MTDERLDAAFAALADPTRRAIVSRLARGDATVNELAAPFAMSLPGVFEAPAGARAQWPHLAPARRAVPALSPRGGGAGRRARLDQHAPARLGRAVRQARRAPAGVRETSPPERRRDRGRRKSAASTQRGLGVSERDELHFTRVVEAPRELVFRCMIEPEHLTHFWGPDGGQHAPSSDITVDARPGGVFEDRDGQRRRRERVPDTGRLRRGAPARAAVVDRGAVGYAGEVASSSSSARTAPRCASTSCHVPDACGLPTRRPVSRPRSIASRRTAWSSEAPWRPTGASA